VGGNTPSAKPGKSGTGGAATDFTCGVLTVSDKGAAGERQDTSGPAVQEILAGRGFDVVAYTLVADDVDSIKALLIEWTDHWSMDLVITTGGTGVAPRDVTPEATRAVIDREVPGISEAMRMASLRNTPHAVLSRGISGIRGTSLIINLPGSEKAARENIEAVLPALPHALYKIKGGKGDCGG